MVIEKMKQYLNYRSNHNRYRAMLAIITAIVVTVVGIVILYQYPRLAQASSAGPRTATASSDCTDDSSNGGTAAWTSPGSASSNADGGASANVSLGKGATSDYVKCLNFGFTTSMIPTGSTINGIILSVVRDTSASGLGNDSAVRLVKGGVIGTTDRSTATTWPTTLTNEDHGTSTDMWGTTWTVSDVTSSTFGAAVAATNTTTGHGTTGTFNIDYMQITIYYTPPPTLTQRHYIWQNDDGSTVNGNTTNGTADTSLTNVKKGERLNARIQVDNTASTGSDWTNGQFALQYDKNDNSWVNMTASTELRPGYGLSGSNGDALTSNAAGTCTTGTTFSNGMWMSGSSWNQPLTIAASKCTEVGFVIDTSNATNGTTYRLRLYDQTDGRVLDAYSVYPTLTVVSSGSDTIRASKDNVTQMSTCTASGWGCEIIGNFSEGSGGWAGMTMGPNGDLWAALPNTTTNVMTVAQRIGGATGNCYTGNTSNWQCTVIDNSASVGHDANIATGPDGTIWVVYRDVTNTSLKVATNSNKAGMSPCSAAGWYCTTVDNQADVGYETNFAFDNSGNPWISYYDATNTSVKVANFVGSGGNCTSTYWNCTTVDTLGTTTFDGDDSSIRFDSNGIPWMSYSDAGNSSLKLATKGGGFGSPCTDTSWTCGTVDNTGTVGTYTSLAIDAGNTLWITYADSGSNLLRYAQYVGTGGNCTSAAFNCAAIDAVSTIGPDDALLIAPNGKPAGAYYGTGNVQRYIYYVGSGGTGCANSTAWSCLTVDSTADEGTHVFNRNLVIDADGAPNILYYDNTSFVFKAAKMLLPSYSNQVRARLDNLGYAYISSNDTNLDPLPGTTNVPMFRFDTVGSTNSSNIQPTWIGQSSVAASTDNIKLQIWRGGTTNAWVDMATNSSCAANTDCTIQPTAISTNLGEYYDPSGSQYILHFRVYQDAGSSQTLQTNYFTATTAQTLSAVFLTPIRSLTAAVCGGAAQVFTLQLQNASGVATTPTDSTVIQITSNSGGYTVYSDSSCTNVVSSGNLTFTTADSSKDFYLIDTATGGHTVTATKQSGTDSVSTATQSYTVGSVPGVQLKGGTKLQGGTKIQ